MGILISTEHRRANLQSLACLTSRKIPPTQLPTSMSWLSSFFNPVYCEEAVPSNPSQESSATHNKDDTPGKVNEEKLAEATTKTEHHDVDEKEESEDAPAEEEEEEEPEDVSGLVHGMSRWLTFPFPRIVTSLQFELAHLGPT